MSAAKAERRCAMKYLSLRADSNILQAPTQFPNLFSLPGYVVPLTVAGLSQLFQHCVPVLKPLQEQHLINMLQGT